jgi:hypothetical protein
VFASAPFAVRFTGKISNRVVQLHHRKWRGARKGNTKNHMGVNEDSTCPLPACEGCLVEECEYFFMPLDAWFRYQLWRSQNEKYTIRIAAYPAGDGELSVDEVRVDLAADFLPFVEQEVATLKWAATLEGQVKWRSRPKQEESR